jgi:hypothetical protein
VPHLAKPERLRNSERPIPEFRFGREQLNAHAIRGESPQRQRSLECGDAASRDQHAKA